MVDWPATGDTDWNTKMLAYLAIEHNTNGTHDVHDTEGGYMQVDVDGTKTNVYTKYFTGTLDNDSLTNVAHGVAGAPAKILAIVVSLEAGTGTFRATDYNDDVSATAQFLCNYDATNVIIDSVGSDNQGNSYHVKVDYIL